jgi:AcrR family transcriptional regulator
MENKYNTKQIQILEKGKELFWKYGLKRVSIEEICREAGISKMTFYKYFPNKNELAFTILDEIFDESIRKIRSMGEEHSNPEETLEKILHLKFEGTLGISEEFMKDIYASPAAPMQEYINNKTTEVLNEVILLYEKGKEDGWVRKDLNVPLMLYFTWKSIEVVTKDDIPPFFKNPQDMIMELTRLFIYGIAPHHKK